VSQVKIERGVEAMLRWAITRMAAKTTLILAGIAALVLGAHGMYVHFSDIAFYGLEGHSSRYMGDLFLALDVPGQFDGIVEWFGIKGIQLWLIPFGFIVLGCFLEYLQSNIPVGGQIQGLVRRPAAGGVIHYPARSRVYINSRRRYRW